MTRRSLLCGLLALLLSLVGCATSECTVVPTEYSPVPAPSKVEYMRQLFELRACLLERYGVPTEGKRDLYPVLVKLRDAQRGERGGKGVTKEQRDFDAEMCRKLEDFLWRIEARHGAKGRPLRPREEIEEAVQYVEQRSDITALLLEAAGADHLSRLHERDQYLSTFGIEGSHSLPYSIFHDAKDELNAVLVRMWFALEDGDLAGWTDGAELLLRLGRLHVSAPDASSSLAMRQRIAGRVDDLIRARLSTGAAGRDELEFLRLTHNAFNLLFNLRFSIELARLETYSNCVHSSTLFSVSSEYQDDEVGRFGLGHADSEIIDSSFGIYAHTAKMNRASIDALEQRGAFEKNDEAIRVHPRLKIVAPSPRIMCEDFRREQVLRDGVSIMIALETRRYDVGRYPGLLEQLVPEYLKDVPRDWFSGEAFRYVLSSDWNDYTLYSVAENGVDDGGATRWHGQPLHENPRLRKADRVFRGPGLVRPSIYPE